MRKKIHKEKLNDKVCCRRIGMFPIILIVVGLIALLQNFNIVPNAWGKLWPLILIGIGIMKIYDYYCINNCK